MVARATTDVSNGSSRRVAGLMKMLKKRQQRIRDVDTSMLLVRMSSGRQSTLDDKPHFGSYHVPRRAIDPPSVTTVRKKLASFRNHEPADLTLSMAPENESEITDGNMMPMTFSV